MKKKKSYLLCGHWVRKAEWMEYKTLLFCVKVWKCHTHNARNLQNIFHLIISPNNNGSCKNGGRVEGPASPGRFQDFSQGGGAIFSGTKKIRK